MLSPLYRTLGWAGAQPLFWASLDTNEIISDTEIVSLNTHRGGDDPSSHNPSTLTLATTRNVDFSSQSISIDLSDAAAAHIAGLTSTTPAAIQTRFFGRRGATTTRDTGRGRRGTELTAASWDSMFPKAPDTYNPGAGVSLSAAGIALFSPSWAPARAGVFGVTDTWHEAPGPVTAGDVLDALAQRLHLFSPERSGYLRIRTLDNWLALVGPALADRWPLSRAHVLSPITWEQPADRPTEYEVTIRTPNTSTTIIRTTPDGQPTGTTQMEMVDWTAFVSQSEHWRRWYGRRSSTVQHRWALPSLRVRLDKLINHPNEDHRRAAGMLLALEVGDPVPLAGDWPDILTGAAYCTTISEQITAAGWYLELSLIPHRWINGLDTARPKPRTWAQTRAHWDEPTQTWQEGPAQ